MDEYIRRERYCESELVHVLKLRMGNQLLNSTRAQKGWVRFYQPIPTLFITPQIWELEYLGFNAKREVNVYKNKDGSIFEMYRWHDDVFAITQIENHITENEKWIEMAKSEITDE